MGIGDPVRTSRRASGQIGITVLVEVFPVLELKFKMVMARMQADNDLRGIPVVFLTARALHTDIERGMAAGARAYVTKPFDALRLAERLADILNGPAELAAAI